MKKRFALLLGCALLLASCADGTVKQEEKAPQEAWKIVDPKNPRCVQAYTIDESGGLYTVEIPPEGTQDALGYELNQYDEAGVCVRSTPVGGYFGEGLQTLAYADKKLYYAPKCYDGDMPGCVLFSCDTQTWQEERIAELAPIECVTRIVPMGGKIYLLGSTSDSSVRHHDGGSYHYDGRRLYVVNPDTSAVSEIPIAEPVDMAAAEDGQLLLYAHTGDAFSFLFYDPAKNAIKTISVTDECILSYFAYSPQGQEVIYNSAARGVMLCAPLKQPMQTAEVFPEDDPKAYNVICADGWIAVRNHSGQVVRFALDAVKRENRTIRYVSDSLVERDAPYGCGFVMERTRYDPEKLALKILAQDADFDISYIDTFYGTTGRNLQENGAFYPLNDVPGIEEYLDACFPYVRKAATDEDGNIWMFPLLVDIPIFLCNTEREEGRFLLDGELTYERFFEEQKKLDETLRKETAVYALPNHAMLEYSHYYHSVDTSEFRGLLTAIKDGKQSLNRDMSPDFIDFIYLEFDSTEGYLTTLSVQQKGDAMRACPYPKLAAGGKNIGSCRGIVVNPRSDNLDVVLNYVSVLAEYCANGDEKPLFFQSPAFRDDSYRGSLYRVYENGEIAFCPDDSLYEGWRDVIEGNRDIEEYIAATEPKLKMYFGE